jgi:hypothetical protein
MMTGWEMRGLGTAVSAVRVAIEEVELLPQIHAELSKGKSSTVYCTYNYVISIYVAVYRILGNY